MKLIVIWGRWKYTAFWMSNMSDISAQFKIFYCGTWLNICMLKSPNVRLTPIEEGIKLGLSLTPGKAVITGNFIKIMYWIKSKRNLSFTCQSMYISCTWIISSFILVNCFSMKYAQIIIDVMPVNEIGIPKNTSNLCWKSMFETPTLTTETVYPNNKTICSDKRRKIIGDKFLSNLLANFIKQDTW